MPPKKKRSKRKVVSKAKAKKILKHGEVQDKPLTKKQEGYFGARAGGAPVRKAKAKPTRKRRSRRKTSSKSRKRR